LINKTQLRHRAAIDLSRTVANTAAVVTLVAESGATTVWPEPAGPVDG
jgi:hypothetical protein